MSERITTYADAVAAVASAEGALEQVETELSEIARAVDANRELRERLVDIQMPIGQRLALVSSEALAGAHPATRTALSMLIAAEMGGDLTDVARAVSQRAAEARDQELAEVFVATPIDDARKQALTAALEHATGKKLDVKVYVDPSVVGGVRAKVGDTVIDGSIAQRLADVKARLAG